MPKILQKAAQRLPQPILTVRTRDNDELISKMHSFSKNQNFAPKPGVWLKQWKSFLLRQFCHFQRKVVWEWNNAFKRQNEKPIETSFSLALSVLRLKHGVSRGQFAMISSISFLETLVVSSVKIDCKSFDSAKLVCMAKMSETTPRGISLASFLRLKLVLTVDWRDFESFFWLKDT